MERKPLVILTPLGWKWENKSSHSDIFVFKGFIARSGRKEEFDEGNPDEFYLKIDTKTGNAEAYKKL